ncbi:MAG: transposase [Phycisphaerales bacterium]|nr:MAG: transposase [Phycisphaerales bacterium]
MPQSLAAVYIHLVFSTKDRHPYLTDVPIRGQLHAYLGGVSKNLDCPPVRIGGVGDHVHILARLGRTIAIADWVKELKRVSNIWMQGQGAAFADFRWQAGYGAFSVSQSNVARVAEYIDNQEAHHRRRSFEDELRELFSKHGLEFDERYVWD